MIARRLRLPGLLCWAALFAACGSAKYEWSQANTLNTIPAYQGFLSKYPNDVHAADAKKVALRNCRKSRRGRRRK